MKTFRRSDSGTGDSRLIAEDGAKLFGDGIIARRGQEGTQLFGSGSIERSEYDDKFGRGCSLIGVLTGVGSIIYCLALIDLPLSLVVTLSNLYIVVTALLGMSVLRESVTVMKIAGLALTLLSCLLMPLHLSWSPLEFGLLWGGILLAIGIRFLAMGKESTPANVATWPD